MAFEFDDEFDDAQFEAALLDIDLPGSTQKPLHAHVPETSSLDLELVRSLVQGTDAWFAARKNKLTASNFGTAAGLSK